MSKTIAVIGAGAMGSAVGRRLVENGLRVLTPLEGRSAATRRRAEGAGLEPVAFEQLTEAALLLSIIPPGQAVDVAERCAQVFRDAGERAVFVDCNAVSPKTSGRIEALIVAAGLTYVDAGIIGGPPAPGKPGPLFYASGPAADQLAELAGFGLRVSVLDQPNGAASALKMAYAGMTKGFTALSSMMMLAATRAGVDQALRAELTASQPALLEWLTRAVPLMYPKAYRWVAEMEEISAFAAADPAAKATFEGAAAFYQQMADDAAGEGLDAAKLSALLTPPKA